MVGGEVRVQRQSEVYMCAEEGEEMEKMVNTDKSPIRT